MLTVISIILSFLGCKKLSQNEDSFAAKIDKFREGYTLIFYNISDGNDTCLVCGFSNTPYMQLNIKIIDEATFETFFLNKVVNGEIINVSETYYQETKRYSITSQNEINALYSEFGIDSLLNYAYDYPINQLYKDDRRSFDWVAYLLWKNNIYISLDDEIYWWFIDKDGYRY